MVVDGEQVSSILLGPDGVVEAARPGLLCVDMSTIAPPDTRRIGAALAERGVRMLDAPVTGSSPRAEAGSLTIMAGGAREDFERALPALEAMGEVIAHVGELGQGEMLKLINNAIAAANAAAVAEALVLADASGIDIDDLIRVASSGSGASAQLSLKGRACTPTTTRRCSRPPTCSRTCGSACRRLRTRARPSPPPPMPATCWRRRWRAGTAIRTMPRSSRRPRDWQTGVCNT